MPVTTTVGQILVNDALPEEYRDHGRVLDKAGMTDLLRKIAEERPEDYREVSHRLAEVGRTVAQETGGYSFGLRHIRKSRAGVAVRERVQRALSAILDDDSLSDKDRESRIVELLKAEQGRQQDEVYKELSEARNPLASQVRSGARGNKMNLSSLTGSDLLYVDHKEREIPLPVLRSYAEGLTPAEYWAGAYGARKGTIDVKQATQKAGYFGKQLVQLAHRLVVTDVDARHDVGLRGLPVDVDDPDNEGALLAQDVGPYRKNTVLTPAVQQHLSRLGKGRILVRSPVALSSPEGGVYARDLGIREQGSLPGVGEPVGGAAAQAIAEPVSQGSLSSKHSGGVAGAAQAVGGFRYIDALVQAPKVFPHGATHAQADGRVTEVRPAPAGGFHVHAGGEEHYVPPGLKVLVSPGDEVEAGDVLSEGIPSPAEMTRHKGVGEGRRAFVDAMRRTLRASGIKGHRRNIELLARGLVNHVRMTDEYGDYAPGDVVPYSAVEHGYSPREGYLSSSPRSAAGRYLERPYLHYSVGTKVRPSVVKELEHFGVGAVDTHPDPPPFEPHFVRASASLQNDPDWMTRMYGSGLKKGLLSAAQRGAVSDELGTSFVPGLAHATDFGRVGLVKTPTPVKSAGLFGPGPEPGAAPAPPAPTAPSRASLIRPPFPLPGAAKPGPAQYPSPPERSPIAATAQSINASVGKPFPYKRDAAAVSAVTDEAARNPEGAARLADAVHGLDLRTDQVRHYLTFGAPYEGVGTSTPEGARLLGETSPAGVPPVWNDTGTSGDFRYNPVQGVAKITDRLDPAYRPEDDAEEAAAVNLSLDGVLRHETEHALAGGRDFASSADPRLAADVSEIPPSVGDFVWNAEYARRALAPKFRGAAYPHPKIPLAPGYSPSDEWMRRQGHRHGFFEGRSTTELMATPSGRAWLRMLMDRHNPAPEKAGADKSAELFPGMNNSFANMLPGQSLGSALAPNLKTLTSGPAAVSSGMSSFGKTLGETFYRRVVKPPPPAERPQSSVWQTAAENTAGGLLPRLGLWAGRKAVERFAPSLGRFVGAPAPGTFAPAGVAKSVLGTPTVNVGLDTLSNAPQAYGVYKGLWDSASGKGDAAYDRAAGQALAGQRQWATDLGAHNPLMRALSGWWRPVSTIAAGASEAAPFIEATNDEGSEALRGAALADRLARRDAARVADYERRGNLTPGQAADLAAWKQRLEQHRRSQTYTPPAPSGEMNW